MRPGSEAPPERSAFGRKLERLRPPDERPAPTARPSLDELRARITAVIEREPPPPRTRAPERDREAVWEGSSFGSLPFIEEETPTGGLYMARKRTPIAARFGIAPLYPAVLADASLLALLALDPALEAIDPKRVLYLDTETTGLSGGTGTVAFLIGLAYYDDAAESFVVEQLLLRDLGEETPMLELVRERLLGASAVVTYNGKAFDLPLLSARTVMNRLPPLPVRPHLDLLHVARRIHKGSIASCTLKRIEEDVLGHVRFDDVAGQEISLAYFHYLRTGDESVLAGVVEHNVTDVLAMIALMGFYGEPIGLAGDSPEGGSALPARDLVGVASTLRRAGALDRALAVADSAVARGGGARAHRVRGDIEKARGEKLRALAEYEVAAADLDDPTLRLSLAKLYEHASRSFEKALDVVHRGTGELPEREEKRRARIARKLVARSVAEPRARSAKS